jgi:hypothetical protein
MSLLVQIQEELLFYSSILKKIYSKKYNKKLSEKLGAEELFLVNI